MAYEKIDPQPAGLAPGEAAVRVDGATVAVAIEQRLLENGGGIAITGRARLIDDQGVTMAAACGAPIATAHAHSGDAVQLERHGAAALAREVLLLVLGEPPTLVDDAPIIDASDEVRINASIRTTIAWAEHMRGSADAMSFL